MWGFGGAQLVNGVVAGQHGARMNAAVPRGLDVVLHVADEKRFVGLEIIFAENLVDFFALVPDIGVRPVEKRVEAEVAVLRGKMIGVNGAQEKRADFVRATKFQKRARVRQFNDGSLRLTELAMKPVLQLRHRHVRRVAVIEFFEGQRELGAEFFQRHRRLAGLREDEVRRLQNGGQIIHQSPRPVENDVANHAKNLTAKTPRRQDKEFFSVFSVTLWQIFVRNAHRVQ